MLFKFRVAYDRELFDTLVLYVRNKLDHKHFTRAIIDIRSVKGDIPFMDRYDLAISIAKTLPYKYKLAVLAERPKITKFAENVAVNNGANFFVSHSIKKIKEWFG